MIFNLHFNDGTASIKSSQSSTDFKVTRNGPCIGHNTTMDKSLPARPFLSAFSSLCRNYLCAENTKLLTYLSPNNDKSINKHFFEVVEVVHEAANSSILIMSSFVPYYRPQRSLAKVMLLQASVILSTGGVSASVHAGIHPPGSRYPSEQTPPKEQTPSWSRHPPEQTPPRADTSIGSRHPPSRPPRADTPPGSRAPQGADTSQSRHPLGADTPQSRHPPEQTPPNQTPPLGADTPPEADSGLQSTSGRYASYWNAFLLFLI